MRVTLFWLALLGLQAVAEDAAEAAHFSGWRAPRNIHVATEMFSCQIVFVQHIRIASDKEEEKATCNQR